MKHRYFLYSIAFLLIFLSSCIKSKAEKLVGTWAFEKVKWREIAISAKDITEDYRLSSIRFESDSSFLYYDAKKDSISRGIWALYSYSEWDNNNQESKDFQDIYLFFEDTTQFNGYFERVWKKIEVGRSRLKAKEESFGGDYEYKLCRVGKK